ncbi:MAG: NAD(P)-binding protein, partial [Solirubrobacterales bacterium]|nr:NAD(P)-binding protein [Solirubrobacterales bacterium]
MAAAERAPGTSKTKVAVLGGGIGAMVAAFELTAPELKGRYEVTVYQPGWRLGGKCASGRSGPENRIEEHGLHVWFGFYANAFRMIQRCYEEWKPPEASPLQTWRDAFKKCNDIVLFERWRGEWTPWPLHLEPDHLEPGVRPDVTPWQFLHRMLDWLVGEWQRVREQHADALPPAARTRRAPLLRLPELVARVLIGGEHIDYELLELARLRTRRRVEGRSISSTDRQLLTVASLLRRFQQRVFGDVLERGVDRAEVRRFA